MDCWCCLALQSAGILIVLLGSLGAGAAAWYGLTVEMIGKGDWGWRNWHALTVTSLLSVAGLLNVATLLVMMAGGS